MAKSKAPVIIITGGTGAGKSTVAAVFKKLQARVVDADRLARRLLKPGEPAWYEILREFCDAHLEGPVESGKHLLPGNFFDHLGRVFPNLPWVINSQGVLRRDQLGAMVFSDPRALETLNRIVHPRLRKLLDAKIELHRKLSQRPLVMDIAVYPERPFRGLGDVVLWVRAPGGLRAQRLADHKRLTLEDASIRVRAQWTDEEFEKIADFILPNLGSDEELRYGAERLWPKLLIKASGGSAE
jgi:dephospho-CoA kinase